MTDPQIQDGEEPDPESTGRTTPDHLEADRFEQMMAEVLGQESDLEPDELDILLAAGEQEGDLENDEFAALHDLAVALELSGTVEEFERMPLSPEETKAATGVWGAIVEGDRPDGLPREARLHQGATAGRIGPATRSRVWWKRPASLSFAVAALFLCAFIAGQRFGSSSSEPGDRGVVIPDGTLGGDPNAPNLTPSLVRNADGGWVFALDDLPEDALRVLRDLEIEVQAIDEDGVWRAQGVGVRTLESSSVRWTWPTGDGAEGLEADGIRFKVYLVAPAGRQSWSTGWFLGVDSLTPQ